MKNNIQIHFRCTIYQYIAILTTLLLIAILVSCDEGNRFETEQEFMVRSPKHLFILAGQSNMAFLNTELYFTPIVYDEFMGDVIVVKHAVSGSAISKWYDSGITGPAYETMIDMVNDATKDQITASITFIWMQGERDARLSTGYTYGDNLRGLINQIRIDLAQPDLNYVIGRLGLYGLTDPAYHDWEIIRAVQVEVADESEFGSWVDTDDCEYGSVHYTADGYKLLGEKFAEAAIELLYQ